MRRHSSGPLRQRPIPAVAFGSSPERGLTLLLLARDPARNGLQTFLTVPLRGEAGKPLGLVAGSIDGASILRLLNTRLVGLGRSARTDLMTLQSDGTTRSFVPTVAEAGSATTLRFEPPWPSPWPTATGPSQPRSTAASTTAPVGSGSGPGAAFPRGGSACWCRWIGRRC